MKFFAVDPYSQCQFCGHTRNASTTKQICHACGQVIKPNVKTSPVLCEKCHKPLKHILIGEKVDDRHVFLLTAYPELNITSSSGWKKFLTGKKVVDAHGEELIKNLFFYLIRTWPKVKDYSIGKRVKVELLAWDSEGNEITHRGESAWVMVYEKGE